MVSLPVWTEARLSNGSSDRRDDAPLDVVDDEIVRQLKMGQEEMKGVVDEFLLDE